MATLKDYGVLKEGVLAESAGYDPLSKSAKSTLGIDFTLRPETPLGFLPAVGGFVNMGQVIGKYQTEDAATKFLNQQSPNKLSTDFSDTLKRVGTGNSATNAMIKEIRQEKGENKYSTSPNITRDDIQNYMMKKAPQLDLAPIQMPKYTQKQLDQASDFSKQKQVYNVQPFRSGGTFRAFDDLIDPKTGAFDYNAPFTTFDEIGNTVNTGRTFGEEIRRGTFDGQIKSTDQFAEDKIGQVNFGTRDAQGNFKGAKGYDPAFARAVTIENQKAAGSDSPGEATFICTALYQMGDMKKYIYKYDQVYGKRVDPNVYRGYCVWGEYVATKMRDKGIVYKIAKPLALAWAKQMAFDLSKGRYGKNNKFVKVVSRIGEGICYAIGIVANLKLKKGVKYG